MKTVEQTCKHFWDDDEIACMVCGLKRGQAAQTPPPCPRCKQTDHGQTGEHPCPECGLPVLHDAQAPARGAETGPLYVKADPWLRELLFRWKPFEGDQRSNMETELLAALQRVVEEQHRARCCSGDATCHYPNCGCHGNIA